MRTLDRPKPSIARLTTSEPKWAQLPTAKIRMMQICRAMIAPAMRPTARYCGAFARSRRPGNETRPTFMASVQPGDRQAPPARYSAGRAVAASIAVMGSGDAGAPKLRKRHEGQRPAVIDVGADDAERSVGRLLLHDLQHVLCAWRADRDDHYPVWLQLLQQRRRDVVDPAGDDDLVERGLFLPAVVAVGAPGGDGLVLGIALGDQRIVNSARPLG